MSNFALIGHPISHSKSPLLFKASYGSEHNYSLIHSNNLIEALQIFLEGNYKGINITAPFKEQLFKAETINFINKYFNFIPDNISQTIASANILIKDGKTLRAYNSDYLGVKRIIEELIKNNYKIENVAVVGIGGSGKAAALAAKDLGYNLTMVNRSKQEKFANEISCNILTIEESENALKDSQLTIYTIPVNIDLIQRQLIAHPQLLLEANYAEPTLSHIYDQKYNNSKNLSTKKGIYINGLYWLLNQAIPAFELFTCEIAQVEAMKKILNLY